MTVDIAAGAAQDSAGNLSEAADQFSIIAELTPVPALPVAGTIVLARSALGCSPAAPARRSKDSSRSGLNPTKPYRRMSRYVDAHVPLCGHDLAAQVQRQHQRSARIETHGAEALA